MIRAGVIVAVIGLVGCGGAERARLQISLDETRVELQSMHASFEAQRQRLQSLDDRLAMLEDRAEAQRIHGAMPSLPVVRLNAPKQAAPVVEQRYVTNITQSDVTPHHQRRRRGPVPPPANAANAGNIGVQPVGPLTDGASPKPTAKGPSAEALRDPAVQAYRDAKTLYARGDLAAAIPALDDFARKYPRHAFADNALFILARAYYDRAQYAAAIKAFRRVVSAYPTGTEVPDALLMIGRTQMKMGRAAEGRETLARLIALFPNGDAARRAQAELGSHGSM